MAQREWRVGQPTYADGSIGFEVDVAELERTAFEIVAMLRRVGGTAHLAAVRQKYGDNTLTTHVLVSYNSVAPTTRREPEAVADPEPAAAEEQADLEAEVVGG